MTTNPNINEPTGECDSTGHYACAERMEIFKEKTVGCCCVGHICKVYDDEPEYAPQTDPEPAY